jgi:hypothetical protein
MAATIDIPAGGYRYIPFAFQYSGGVAALDGYRIERVEFAQPLPLAAGFAWIEQFLGKQGIPLVAFCACEVRSPTQFTDTGFIEFNRHYADTLQRWGVMTGDDNPVARSNVIPHLHKPVEPGFHAFCFARPAAGASGSFVIAGSGEAGDGPAPCARRRDRPPRRSATRAHVALCAPAGGGSRVRNGLPLSSSGTPWRRVPVGLRDTDGRTATHLPLNPPPFRILPFDGSFATLRRAVRTEP